MYMDTTSVYISALPRSSARQVVHDFCHTRQKGVDFVYTYIDVASLLSDDVMELATLFVTSPATKDMHHVVCLVADQFPEVSQNKMLKMIEELPLYTTLFLCAPSIEAFMQTIRSRAECIDLSKDTDSDALPHYALPRASLFCRMSFTARIAFIAEYHKEHEDHEQADLRGAFLYFCKDMRSYLQAKDYHTLPTYELFCTTLLYVERIALTQSLNLRATLESLALLLPEEKDS
jgi:hypothetical protein